MGIKIVNRIRTIGKIFKNMKMYIEEDNSSKLGKLTNIYPFQELFFVIKNTYTVIYKSRWLKKALQLITIPL